MRLLIILFLLQIIIPLANAQVSDFVLSNTKNRGSYRGKIINKGKVSPTPQRIRFLVEPDKKSGDTLIYKTYPSEFFDIFADSFGAEYFSLKAIGSEIYLQQSEPMIALGVEPVKPVKLLDQNAPVGQTWTTDVHFMFGINSMYQTFKLISRQVVPSLNDTVVHIELLVREEAFYFKSWYFSRKHGIVRIDYGNYSDPGIIAFFPKKLYRKKRILNELINLNPDG